ncbi:Astacin-like metalloprotease toxin [Leptotrombidium deliense]|uniref:Metalloendopeptidase n=1 Tax=Leptotrombidium deliense TaxID=299467 RepID=A0A443SG79_9ACAR|nr:Astacin-like metalloprotease toxin [Leptotrombidium deliense]
MRSDRDEYLNIHWQNIPYNFQSQFRKLNPYEGRIYTPFDYESIMLYGARAFSRDGYSITMSPTKPGIVLRDAFQKKYLSNYDAQSINKLYNC